MPRKKYTHVSHDIPRLSEWDYWPSSLRGQGQRNPIDKDTIARWRQQVLIGKGPRNRKPQNLLYMPVNAGFNDPLTIMCVVDLILRSETDTYIEAGEFSARLQDLYGHLVMFDAISVGRILSALTQWHQNLPRPHYGPDDKDGVSAIAYISTGNVRRYVIMESIQGWDWLGRVRDYLGNKTEERQRHARLGETAIRDESIWEDGISEIPWFRPT